MGRQLTTIGFDADDTLWQNEHFFRLTEARFAALLADHAPPEAISGHLLEVERRNLQFYGYGIKGFTLSMVETAITLTGGRVPAPVIAEILSAGREMYDPPHKLKFASVASYYDTMRMNVAKLYKEKNAKLACTLYQDDDYGLEVVRGAEAGLKDIGATMGEKTTYKRGATDFSSQIARLKASNCDFLVLGTIIRETIGAIGEARKTGWNPTIVGSQAAFTDLIHKLGGKAMDGFYAVSTVYFPYLDVEQQALRFWATKYKTKFGEDPSTYATGTYATIEIFIRAAQKAGPNLSTDSFIKAMETMGEIPADMFGTPPLSFSTTKRLGSALSRLSQIQDGRWKVVSDLR